MQDSREQVSSELYQLEGDIFFAIVMLVLSPCIVGIGVTASVLLFSFSMFWNLLLLSIGVSYIYFLLSLWPGLRSKFRTRESLKRELEALAADELGFRTETTAKKRSVYDIEDELQQVESAIPRHRIYRNFLHIILIISLIRAVMYPSETNLLMIGIGIVYFFFAYLGILAVSLESYRRREDLRQELQASEHEAGHEVSDAAEWHSELEPEKKKKEA